MPREQGREKVNIMGAAVKGRKAQLPVTTRKLLPYQHEATLLGAMCYVLEGVQLMNFVQMSILNVTIHTVEKFLWTKQNMSVG